MKKLLVWLAVAAIAVLLAYPLALSIRVSPALAGEVEAVVRPALVIPWGDMLLTVVQVFNAAIVPIAGVYIGRLLKAYAPALSQMLTNALIDRMVRLAGDFALQAVEGAAKGRTTTVAVAPAVIAVGAQRAVDTTLPWIVNAAGGPEAIAGRLFRHLDLEPAASANNVLVPAIDLLAGASPHA